MQHPEPHDLTALAYDLVDADEREQLLEHLASCDRCRGIYDSYREEQTLVREAVIRDARSGPAEARALERTLVMLGAAESVEQKPAGKLLRMPLWMVATQVAALLVVAVGVFIVLNPEPEVVRVSESDRIPASVEQGEVMVEYAGEWRPADAVPANTLARVGQNPVSLRFKDGSVAELKPGAAFRVQKAEGTQSVMELFAGEGRVTTSSVARWVVLAGDTDMQAMPGTSLSLTCSPRDEQWRQDPRLLQARQFVISVSASVEQGDVVVNALRPEFAEVPLIAGDRLRWTTQDMVAYDSSGANILLNFQPFYAPSRDLTELTARVQTMDEHLTRYAYRLNLFRERHPQAELRVNLDTIKLFQEQLKGQYLEINTYQDATSNARRLKVTGGSNLVFWVDGKSFVGDSPEEIKPNLPEGTWELFRNRFEWHRSGNLWKVEPKLFTARISGISEARIVESENPVVDPDAASKIQDAGTGSK